MSATAPALAALIEAYHARKPPRTWSLIVTLFGDHVLPRGKTLRLGDLTGWMEALGIEPGLVRTALSRLVSNGTLARERDGRSALYRLSRVAEQEFIAASNLIYGRRLPVPSDMLLLAIIEDGADRQHARHSLLEQGFVALGPNVLLRPGHAGFAPRMGEGVLLFEPPANADIARRALTLWPLATLAEGYRRVIGFADAIYANPLHGDEAFLARLLLVHEFRRLVLKDPFLPRILLPSDWPGEGARRAFDAALLQLKGD